MDKALDSSLFWKRIKIFFPDLKHKIIKADHFVQKITVALKGLVQEMEFKYF
jgi:hypothetical protein